MSKLNLTTGKELLNEAVKLQNEFLKTDTYRSLETCLDGIIANENVITNEGAITSARIVARGIDFQVECI